MRLRSQAPIASWLVGGCLILAGCTAAAPATCQPTLSTPPPAPALETGEVTSPPAEGGPAATGGLEVRVEDHQAAIDQFLCLEVTIATLGIHPAEAEGAASWEPLPIAAKTLDLAALVGGPYAVLFRGEAGVGAYDGIRLGIQEISGVLKDGSRPEVTPADFEAFLGFEVVVGQETVVLLDLVVLDVSEHATPGYLLILASASLVWE